MTDDNQLPAVQSPDGAIRLDVETRRVLKEADFDPRIIESVQTLHRIGVKVSPGSSAGYVLNTYYERMEGLRQGRKAWMDLSRDTRREITQLKKEVRELAGDPDDAAVKKHAKLLAEIQKLTKDLADYDMMQKQLGQSIGETGKDILNLEEKLKGPVKPAAGGNMSWDPDQPPSVNLQVNVSGGGSVSVDEKP